VERVEGTGGVFVAEWSHHSALNTTVECDLLPCRKPKMAPEKRSKNTIGWGTDLRKVGTEAGENTKRISMTSTLVTGDHKTEDIVTCPGTIGTLKSGLPARYTP
jgi:hypothetical protein